jgi:hypothetical protein
MFRPSWDCHQAVLYNTARLIELSIWIHILVQAVHIIKVVEVVPCVMMRITVLKYQKIYKKLYLKMIEGN